MNFFLKKAVLSVITFLTLSTTPIAYAASDSVSKAKENQSLWQKIKAKVRAFNEELAYRQWASFYGDKDVCPEIDAYIRAILTDLKFENVNEIRIKKLSKIAMYNGMGEKNACAITLWGMPRYIYINEDWFKTLSEEKKQFLIRHEAMHLKCNHSNKRIKAALISIVPVCIAHAAELWLFLKNYKKDDPAYGESVAILKKSTLKKMLYLEGFAFISLLVGQYFINEMIRKQEYEADALAVHSLGNCDGACQLFEEFEQYEQELDLELPQRADLVLKRKLIRDHYSTHPSNQDRIVHVKKIINETKNN